MNKKQKGAHLKKIRLIIMLAILLLLMVVGIYLFRMRLIVPSAQVVGPSFSITSVSNQVSPDELFDADIVLDTDNRSVASVDTHFTFDPQMLEVQDANSEVSGIQIREGNLFPRYSNNQADNAQGKIDLSASTTAQGGVIVSQGVFARITFKALKAGTTNVNFDYTSGSTTDTNIWNEPQSQTDPIVDILAGVENGTFTIGTPSTPTPSPTVSSGSSSTKKRTPTPSPIVSPTQDQTQTQPEAQADAQAEAVVEESAPQNASTPTPTPAPVGLTSSSPSPNLSPRQSLTPFKITPNPTFSPSGKLAGFSMTLWVSLLFYLGIPALITLISYLIWIQIKRRRGEIPTPPKEKSQSDDDEFDV